MTPQINWAHATSGLRSPAPRQEHCVFIVSLQNKIFLNDHRTLILWKYNLCCVATARQTTALLSNPFCESQDLQTTGTQ